MRKVLRSGIPEELDSDACKAHLDLVLADPATEKISTDFYKGRKENDDGSTEFTVRTALKLDYKDKCAYCEASAHDPSIDHFRPKGYVTGMPRKTYGYYWLGYEWTNLLPSCTDCNKVGAKGTHFPVVGVRNELYPTTEMPPRVNFFHFNYESEFNLGERPLLLHPEYCSAEDHFKFDVDGRIIGLTEQGLETVRVLRLDRQDLNGWRRGIYDDKLSELRRIILSYFTLDDPITEKQFERSIFDWVRRIVQEANDETLQFTFFRKYLLNNMDFFFFQQIDPVFEPITREKIVLSIDKLSS